MIMKIKTKEVRDGKHTGKEVWICHYLRPDLDKKALRNVPPTKVLIRNNDELPKNKTVYYSGDHFAPINKSGKVLAKVISPVDNTGYRMRAGNELYVFTEENECITAWNEQVDLVCHELHMKELIASDQWRLQKEELLKAKE